MIRYLIWLWALAIGPVLAAPPPSFEEIRSRWVPSEAYLLDRNGALLQQSRVDLRVRRLPWTPLGAISPALLRAVVLAEDRRFYSHHGVDWRALAGAAWDRLRGGPKRGASTLSMQVAALLDPALSVRSGARSWRQKLWQMRAAWALDGKWRKPQILEAYLNLAGFRGELQGIGAAARGWFGKDPAGLTEAEAFLLAAVLPSPNSDPRRLLNRACAIARSAGSAASCRELRDLAAVFNQAPQVDSDARLAPHLGAQLLRTPGESVATTLDAGVQAHVLSALRQQLGSLNGRNVRDGAAVVVDNDRGNILAYVGSAGPFSKSPKVDGARAPRQAGSTLKPFLYALALERRYITPASLLNDTPVNLETRSGLYIPQNYDRDFKGTVSVRTALASSLNVPAVRMLALVGVQQFRDRLHAQGYLGITEDGEFYGFSLALGSAEVTLLEQVNAYRTLANGGLWAPLRLRAGDAAGPQQRVMSPQAAFLVADILADRAGRSVTFGLDSPLSTRYWSAVKTGTSKDMRDNWCIGFSRKHTVGVWVGNFEGDPMHEVSGITGAAPVWLDIMDALHAGDTDAAQAPPPPGDLVRREIGFQPAVEPPRAEWFIAGTETGAAVSTVPAQRIPRITSPPHGVVIALDPDVPEPNQAVLFIAHAARPGSDFLLDGRNIAPAHSHYKWPPVPGNHRLTLVGREGKVFDTVDFTVRRLRESAR